MSITSPCPGWSAPQSLPGKGSWNATGGWLGAALTFLVIEVGGLYLFFARALFV
jgi:hypothetical protein